MKVLKVLLTLLALSYHSFAQSPVAAEIYISENNYEEAKNEIDKAILVEKKALEPKTWLIRGNVYSTISQLNLDKFKDLNCLETAFDAYQKAISLDKPDGKFAKSANLEREKLWVPFINSGIVLYQAKKYDLAIINFDKASLIKPKDTLAFTLIATSGIALGNDEGAKYFINTTRKLNNELNYPKKVQNYVLMLRLANEKLKDENLFLDLLNEAKLVFPDDSEIISQEINFYLSKNRSEELIKILTEKLTKDPQNANYLFMLGSLYDLKKEKDKAIEFYQKALAIDPNNFDANYNSGANFYNRGVEAQNEATQMKNEEYKVKGAAKKEQAKQFLMKSLTFFEKCYSINNTDTQLKNILKDNYIFLKMPEKAALIK